MNSQLPDHRTPMLNPQYYDDTKLQRRTKFLVSGLLLCFVIGIANLGISVMLLMKNQDQSDLVHYIKNDPQTQEIKTDLKLHTEEIDLLQKKIDIIMKHLNDPQNIGMVEVEDPFKLPIVKVGVGQPTESEDSDNHGSRVHGSHDHGSHDHGSHDHGSHDSHVHGHDHGVHDSHDHGSSHGHDHSNHGAMSDYLSNLHADLLDKNIDLFFTDEGSGDEYDSLYDSENDDEDTDAFEGSGEPIKCVVFPKPFCPEEHQVCWTDDVCPVPFCCSSDAA